MVLSLEQLGVKYRQVLPPWGMNCPSGLDSFFFKPVDHSSAHWKGTVILLILYQTASWDCFLGFTGSPFLLLLQPTAPQIRRKFLLPSDLFDEKTKPYLMRILQSRAWLPTPITSFWDHNELRAQLCFSNAPSSQPTFSPHSQDCLLSFCVPIKGWTTPACYLFIHESREKARPPSDCLRLQLPATLEVKGFARLRRTPK